MSQELTTLLLALAVVFITVGVFALWMRLRRLDVRKESVPVSEKLVQMPAPEITSGVTMPTAQYRTDSAEAVKYEKVWLGDESAPLMSLSTVSTTEDISKFIDIPAESMDRAGLSRMLGELPGMLSGANTTGTIVVRMKLSPELLEGLISGKFDMMRSLEGGFRGNVVTAGAKKVVGQASFAPADGLRVASMAAMGFQLVSFVVGQAHLAAITKKLGEIQVTLGKVLKFLQNERRAKVIANIKNLQSIAGIISSGHMKTEERSTYLGQLLDTERTASEIHEHIRLECPDWDDRIEQLISADWFGCGKTYKNLSKTASEALDYYHDWKTSSGLVFAARYLLLSTVTKANCAAVKDKILDMRQAIDEGKALQLSILKLKRKTHTLLNTKNISCTKESVIRKRKQSVLNVLDTALNSLDTDLKALKSGVSAANETMAKIEHFFSEPTEIIAEIGSDGKIKNVKTIL